MRAAIRATRIQRAPAARFFRIDAGDLERWGLAAATIVGVLDFFDRAEPEAESPLASAAELAEALKGIASRRTVDAALAELELAGVVRRVRKMTIGEKNLLHSVRFALCATRLSEISLALSEGLATKYSESARTHKPGTAKTHAPSKTQKRVFPKESSMKRNNNNCTVVEFSDGTFLADVPVDWADSLRDEVESKVAKTTKAALAQGVLRNWEKGGRPSRSRRKPSASSPSVAKVEVLPPRGPIPDHARVALDKAKRLQARAPS